MTEYTNALYEKTGNKWHDAYIEQQRREKELKKLIPEPFCNFFECAKRLQIEHEKNKVQLEILYYELTGVKGVDYSKQKSTFNQEARTAKYYKISDQIEDIEKKDKYIVICLNLLNKLKEVCKTDEQKEAIEELYYYKWL